MPLNATVSRILQDHLNTVNRDIQIHQSNLAKYEQNVGLTRDALTASMRERAEIVAEMNYERPYEPVVVPVTVPAMPPAAELTERLQAVAERLTKLAEVQSPLTGINPMFVFQNTGLDQ